MFLAAHLLACIWYMIGVTDQTMYHALNEADGQHTGQPGTTTVLFGVFSCNHSMQHHCIITASIGASFFFFAADLLLIHPLLCRLGEPKGLR